MCNTCSTDSSRSCGVISDLIHDQCSHPPNCLFVCDGWSVHAGTLQSKQSRASSSVSCPCAPHAPHPNRILQPHLQPHLQQYSKTGNTPAFRINQVVFMSLTYALGSDQFEQVLHMYGDERIESILLKKLGPCAHHAGAAGWCVPRVVLRRDQLTLRYAAPQPRATHATPLPHAVHARRVRGLRGRGSFCALPERLPRFP